MNTLTKAQEAGVVKLENQLQAIIDAGGNERPWVGMLPAKDNFPERETSNINIIVEDTPLFAKALKIQEALTSTGRYITCDFYGMDLICTCGYEGKVSQQNELQFTEMSISKTNAHGTDEAKEQFAKVFGNGAKKHTLKKAEPVTEPETDPFA